MKKNIIIILISAILTGCIKDKGNYDYTAITEVNIANIPEKIEALGFIDRIQLSPEITSDTDGKITAENTNYSYQYRLGYKGMGSLGGVVDGVVKNWIDITPSSGYELDIPANYNAGNYLCWFTVTDNRSKVVYSKYIDISISSTTFEGWLVLGNEGPEERVRLDMISLLSSTNTTPIYDIANGLPTLHHATKLGFHPAQHNPGDYISIFSKEGSYQLDNESLTSSALHEFNLMGFVLPQSETMLAQYSLPILNEFSWRTRYSFVISDAGNVYVQGHGEAGSMYGYALNTDKAGTTPKYKVAPFAGMSQVRPSNSSSALFYDSDNKRFMGFQDASPNALFALQDPANKLFSYQTGKDLIYMEGTRRSNGLVYAVLEDDNGNRSICGINMGGNGFIQESYLENINAPGFNQAELFAFHSQFPLIFYAVGNKIYLYNLGTNTYSEMTNTGLTTNEEITCLKFNLFKNSRLESLNKQTDEFLNQQFQLIVGSYNTATGDKNGGKVSFYQVNGTNNSISKIIDYTGFAKIKDIVYRERTN